MQKQLCESGAEHHNLCRKLSTRKSKVQSTVIFKYARYML